MACRAVGVFLDSLRYAWLGSCWWPSGSPDLGLLFVCMLSLKLLPPLGLLTILRSLLRLRKIQPWMRHDCTGRRLLAPLFFFAVDVCQASPHDPMARAVVPAEDVCTSWRSIK